MHDYDGIWKEPGGTYQKAVRGKTNEPSGTLRLVVYDNRIHVFSKKHNITYFGMGKYDEFNLGVMFSHLMIVAEELWLDLDLIRLEDISHKNFSNCDYVMSAVLRT